VTRFNLSEWALKHRAFVWYLMLAALVGGVLSYQNLGREEDPPFTIKTMIIQANWPGATVDEMINPVGECYGVLRGWILLENTAQSFTSFSRH
jgi:multidrug efflux pump